MKRRFLRHVLSVMVTICGFVNMNGADLSKVTRADILATVEHIEALSRQQKLDLVKAQSDYNGAITALKEQTILTEQFRKQAHDNAAQRDVFLIGIALIGALYLGTLVSGMILREFPLPWSVICVVLVYAGAFSGIYALGRTCVASLAHLIP